MIQGGGEQYNAGIIVVSSVNLIKWAGVPEATIPHFIDHPGGMGFVFTCRACSHGQNGSAADTLLVLLREFPLPSPKELPRPSALPTERARSNLHLVSGLPCLGNIGPYLGTGRMSKVVRPVNLKS